jgi:septal ring factor EnvC (AmiA/AmiB activator)
MANVIIPWRNVMETKDQNKKTKAQLETIVYELKVDMLRLRQEHEAIRHALVNVTEQRDTAVQARDDLRAEVDHLVKNARHKRKEQDAQEMRLCTLIDGYAKTMGFPFAMATSKGADSAVNDEQRFLKMLYETI